MNATEAKRLDELESENVRLKKLLAGIVQLRGGPAPPPPRSTMSQPSGRAGDVTSSYGTTHESCVTARAVTAGVLSRPGRPAGGSGFPGARRRSDAPEAHLEARLQLCASASWVA